MLELSSHIIAETPDSTFSRLDIDGVFFAFLIEDGHREQKEPGRTRIPAGRYQVRPRMFGEHYEKYKARFGHKFSIEVTGVPEFTNILIHIGNTVGDTKGCPLVNYGGYYDPGQNLFVGKNSTQAYKDLYQRINQAILQETPIFLTINR